MTDSTDTRSRSSHKAESWGWWSYRWELGGWISPPLSLPGVDERCPSWRQSEWLLILFIVPNIGEHSDHTTLHLLCRDVNTPVSATFSASRKSHQSTSRTLIFLIQPPQRKYLWIAFQGIPVCSSPALLLTKRKGVKWNEAVVRSLKRRGLRVHWRLVYCSALMPRCRSHRSHAFGEFGFKK